MKKILIISFIFSLVNGYSQNVSLSELIVSSTIKIESIDKEIIAGKTKYTRSSGTGFFFVFQMPLGNFPVIVTNRHVVKNSNSGTLRFKIADSVGVFRYSRIEKFEIPNFKDAWILHPDTSVDLAILPIGGILNAYLSRGIEILYAAYSEMDIPNDSVLNSLTAIEDILMIGYPFGLKDLKNDLPLVRKGITATPPYLDYNHSKEFLCDVPVYPGSSGSPIIIYNPTSYTVRNGSNYFASRVLLLGINYATYTRDFNGKIIPKPSFNLEDSLITSTPIPYNVGIIIKAERLLEFKKLIERYK